MTETGGFVSGSVQRMLGFACFHGFRPRCPLNSHWLLHILHISSSARPITSGLWGCFGFQGVAYIVDPMAALSSGTGQVEVIGNLKWPNTLDCLAISCAACLDTRDECGIHPMPWSPSPKESRYFVAFGKPAGTERWPQGSLMCTLVDGKAN